MKKLILAISLFLLVLRVHSQIEFVENKGQWSEEVLFKCKLNNGALFVEKNQLLWYFYEMPFSHPQSFASNKQNPFTNPKGLGPADPGFSCQLKAHAFKVVFEGAQEQSIIKGEKPYSHFTNIFKGNDPAKWKSNLRSFEKIFFKNLYPGIDLELFSEGGTVKYNFIVAAHASIADIKMRYEGTQGLELMRDQLKIKTSVNTIIENIPLSYFTDGEGEKIKCDYVLNHHVVSFKAEKTTYTRPLIIDPKLVFSSYSGSTADNWGYTATYDNTGHAYSGGIVFDVGFPSTTGALQVNFGGGVDVDFSNGDISRDMGILKYAPDGKSLVYATYIGGSHNEQPHSMVVNSKNELCILGSTYSKNFPGIKATAFQTSNYGESDIVLLAIDPSGAKINAATYYGGTKRDGLNGTLNSADENTSPLGWNYGDIFRGEIICDAGDNIYIATSTESGNADGIQIKNGEWTTFGGGQYDGLLAVFTGNLTSLLWSTYIGGSGFDAGYGVYLFNNDLYLCGGTNSNNLRLKNPISTPAISLFQGGKTDGYVMHFNASNGKCQYSTYIGTSSYDQCYFVQVDRYGKPYIYGQSDNGNWQITPPIYNNKGAGQFISKMDEKLTMFERSMTFGSGRKVPDISPSAFLVDKCGRIFVSGWGGRVNQSPRGNNGTTVGMPTTDNAYDKTSDGSDFYLGVFNRDMDTLLYGTYFGGHAKGSDGNPLAEHVDGGTSRFDYEGKVYQSVCGGCGGSSAFPTTPGAHSQLNKSTNCNNAIFKIDFENLNYKPTGLGSDLTAFAGDTILFDFVAKDQDKKDSLYLTRKGVVFSTPTAVPFAEMPENAGIGEVSSTFKWMPLCQHISNDTYYVYIQVRDNNQCPQPDTNFSVIKVLVKMPPSIKPPDVVCVAHVDDKTVEISWDKMDESKYFKYYILYRRDPAGNLIILDTIYRNSSKVFIDPNSPNHQFQNYCYFMQGVNICDVYGDTSYKACSADEYKNPIDSVYLYTATVVDNKSVQVKWLKSKEPDFGTYLLFKYSNKSKTGGTPIFYKSISGINDTIFNDSLVSVQDSSYCYTVRVTDKCGHISNYSNVGCTILLKGKSAPYEHQLSWTDYVDWLGGVLKYEITRSDSIDDYFVYVDKTDPTKIEYIDTTMFYDWGYYTYKVVAKEGYKGMGAISESNWVSLYQEPLLWVPTAFTPNDDGINDHWGWQSIFVKTFKIKVYNRWGELIFETENKKDFWNGIYRDKEFHNNLYLWQAEYTGWDNSKHRQTGTVTVLR